MRYCFVAVVLGAAFVASPSVADIRVTTEPAEPFIEMTRLGQALNFDVLISNDERAPVELVEFELTARDERGNIITRRRVGQNGNTIEVIPSREIPAEGRLLVFNPLVQWPADVELRNVELTLTVSADNEDSERLIKHRIRPRAYLGKQSLRLPLDGAVFVHAGHDFMAHHRRFPLHSAMTDALNIRHNVTRYAYDFAVVDARGEMYRGEGKQLADWFGYGAPVLAPAAGTIVEIHDGQPDNEIGKPPRLDRDALMSNPKLLFGNFVLIDHGDGELGLLAHLKPGSISVKAGQRVGRGQAIAAVGMSGDAAIVHLHFQMQAGPGFAEGIPSRFADFARKTGDGWTQVKTGPIEGGEIVQSGSTKTE